VSEDRTDAAEADEDGGGGDEEYEIKALRKTVGSGGKGRDNVATYGTKRPYDLLGFDTPLLDIN
jgi:hypothetical protein